MRNPNTNQNAGTFDASGLQFAVLVARYNESLTNRLLEGALQAMQEHGVASDQISVFKVPGSFELPQAARKIAETFEPDALICLGALLRGETYHFELISNECARGLQEVAADFGIPVTFGVITADTMDQAVKRAGEKPDNKGWEAATAALEMATLYRKLKDDSI